MSHPDQASHLPPGTVRIGDADGEKFLLSPQPTADPNQPLNWSTWRKALHMTILSFYGLMIFAVLCVPPPLWAQMNEELGLSFDDLNNSYATSQGTMAIGCVFFVPIALKYGRRPVYILTAIFELASVVWFGKLQTRGDLYGANILVGLAGAVNEALFQMTVADLFYVHQRATMNGIFLLMVLFGNWLAPVASGYVADAQGWRWVWYYCTAFMGLSTLTIIFGLEESKYSAPSTRNQSLTTASVTEVVAGKEHETTIQTNPAVPSNETAKFARAIEIDTTIPMKSWRQRHALWTLDNKHGGVGDFLLHFYQPFLILVKFPAAMFAALQWGWLIGMLVMLSVVQAFLYPEPPYNFSASGVGLQNLSPAIGCILGCAFGGPLNDYFMLRVAKRRNGIYEPESRLILFLIPGLAMVVGTLTFGLTISAGTPWIINAVGATFIGFSIGACGDMALTYVQDSYQDILGDALVGIVFFRNALATAIDFAIPPMLNLGGKTMFTIIGVLSAFVALTSVPMLIWGRRWRAQLAGQYEKYARRQY